MKISWKEKAKYVLKSAFTFVDGAFLFTIIGLLTILCTSLPLLLSGYSTLCVFGFSFGFSLVVTIMKWIHQIFFSKEIERYMKIDKQIQEDRKERETYKELEKLNQILYELYELNCENLLFLQYIERAQGVVKQIITMTKKETFSLGEEHYWTSTVPRDLTKLFVLFHRMDGDNKRETEETLHKILLDKQSELDVVSHRERERTREEWETVVQITESREIE